MLAAVTVSVAALLVTLPITLETTTEQLPALPDWAFKTLQELPVAPLIADPPKYHWYVTPGRPEAVTVNWTLLPAVTVWLCGCV